MELLKTPRIDNDEKQSQYLKSFEALQIQDNSNASLKKKKDVQNFKENRKIYSKQRGASQDQNLYNDQQIIQNNKSPKNKKKQSLMDIIRQPNHADMGRQFSQLLVPPPKPERNPSNQNSDAISAQSKHSRYTKNSKSKSKSLYSGGQLSGEAAKDTPSQRQNGQNAIEESQNENNDNEQIYPKGTQKSQIEGSSRVRQSQFNLTNNPFPSIQSGSAISAAIRQGTISSDQSGNFHTKKYNIVKKNGSFDDEQLSPIREQRDSISNDGQSVNQQQPKLQKNNHLNIIQPSSSSSLQIVSQKSSPEIQPNLVEETKQQESSPKQIPSQISQHSYSINVNNNYFLDKIQDQGLRYSREHSMPLDQERLDRDNIQQPQTQQVPSSSPFRNSIPFRQQQHNIMNQDSTPQGSSHSPQNIQLDKSIPSSSTPSDISQGSQIQSLSDNKKRALYIRKSFEERLNSTPLRDKHYNKSEPPSLNNNYNKQSIINNQQSFKRQQSRSKEEIIGKNSLLDHIHVKEVNSCIQNKQERESQTDQTKQLTMEEMNEIMKEVGQHIEKMNDTLFICYYASKQGVKYRALLQKENQSRQQNHMDSQELQEEQKVEPPSSSKLAALSQPIQLNQEVKQVLKSQIKLNLAVANQFTNKKDIFENLTKTKCLNKNSILNINSPSIINNFDRQKINQFTGKLDKKKDEALRKLIERQFQQPQQVDNQRQRNKIETIKELPTLEAESSMGSINGSFGASDLNSVGVGSISVDINSISVRLQLEKHKRSIQNISFGKQEQKQNSRNNSLKLNLDDDDDEKESKTPKNISTNNQFGFSSLIQNLPQIDEVDSNQKMQEYDSEDQDSNYINIEKSENKVINKSVKLNTNQNQIQQNQVFVRNLTPNERNKNDRLSVDWKPSQKVNFQQDNDSDSQESSNERFNEQYLQEKEQKRRTKGFQSVQKLKKKLSQNQLENQIFTQEQKVTVKAIQSLIIDNKPKLLSKFSRQNLINYQGLEKINEQGEFTSSNENTNLINQQSERQFCLLSSKLTSKDTAAFKTIQSSDNKMSEDQSQDKIFNNNENNDNKSNSSSQLYRNEFNSQEEMTFNSKQVCMKRSLSEVIQRQKRFRYTDRQKVILRRCLQLMKPLNANQIRQHVNKVDEIILSNQVNKCVSRLAFESDQKYQLEVTQLDYHSLESYKGIIKFTEGMQKLAFNGFIVQDQHIRKTQKISCMDRIRHKIFGTIQKVQFVPYEETITVNRIKGVIFGPHSITFQQYMCIMITDEQIQKIKYDQWRFISILTDNRSFDFIMNSRQDALDLIIAVNNSIQRNTERALQQKLENMNKRKISNDQSSFDLTLNDSCQDKLIHSDKEIMKLRCLNKLLSWNTNTKALKFEFIRCKIKHMASDTGYSMGQYLMMALYHSVVLWPQSNDDEIIKKYNAMSKLKLIIQNTDRLKDLIEVIDLIAYRKLQRIINYQTLENINKLGDEEKERALNQFNSEIKLQLQQNKQELKMASSIRRKTICHGHQQNKQGQQWNSWLKNCTHKRDQTPERRKSVFLKKIRSMKYLEHLSEKKIKDEIQKETLRKTKIIKGSDILPLTLGEWGKTLQLKNLEIQIPDFDESTLEQQKKEIIIWTKKLYDIHRYDRFMNLVQLEEKRLNQKAQTTEKENNRLANQTNVDILEQQKQTNDNIKKTNYDRKNHSSNLMQFPAVQKIIEKEKKAILKQRILHTQDKSIQQILQQQAKLSKKANNEWKLEFRRQQNLLKKSYEIEIQRLKQQKDFEEKIKNLIAQRIYKVFERNARKKSIQVSTRYYGE